MRYLCLFLTTISLWAAPKLSHKASYPTQIVVQLDGVQNVAGCTVEVSTKADFSTLVNYSNAAKGGSMACNQTNNIVNGGSIEMRLGSQDTVLVSTTRNSRALKTATMHYIRVNVDSTTLTLAQPTQTVPFGFSWADPTPASGTGGALWPTLSNSGSTVIDPQTGVEMGPLITDSQINGLGGIELGADSGGYPICTDVVTTVNGETGHQCRIFAHSSDYSQNEYIVVWIGDKGTTLYHGIGGMVYDEAKGFSNKVCRGGVHLSKITPFTGWCFFQDASTYKMNVFKVRLNPLYETGVPANFGVGWQGMNAWQESDYRLPPDATLHDLAQDLLSPTITIGNPGDALEVFEKGILLAYDGSNNPHELITFSWRVAQNRMSVSFAFDPTATSNSFLNKGCLNQRSGHAGQPGCIVAYIDTGGAFDRQTRGRYSEDHGIIPPQGSHPALIASNTLGAKGTGNYGTGMRAQTTESVPSNCTGGAIGTGPCVACPARPSNSRVPIWAWPPTGIATERGCAKVHMNTLSPATSGGQLPGNIGPVLPGDTFAWISNFTNQTRGMVLDSGTDGGGPYWIVYLNIMASSIVDNYDAGFNGWAGAASGQEVYMTGTYATYSLDQGIAFATENWYPLEDPTGSQATLNPCLTGTHYTLMLGVNGNGLTSGGGPSLDFSPFPLKDTKGAFLCTEHYKVGNNTAWDNYFGFVGAYSGRTTMIESHPGSDNFKQPKPATVFDQSIIDVGPNMYDNVQPENAPKTRTFGAVTHTHLIEANMPIVAEYGRISLLSHRKWFPLKDISSPTTLMTDDGAYDYNYCVARANGQCATGSTAGRMYLSLPADAPLTCPDSWEQGVGGGLDAMLDGTCITHQTDRVMRLTEIKLHNNPGGAQAAEGQYRRSLSGIQSGAADMGVFGNPRYNPKGTFIMSPAGQKLGSLTGNQLLKVEVPPAQVDSAMRTTWRKIPIKLNAPAGTATAYLEYGYDAALHKTNYGAGVWDASASPKKFVGDTLDPVTCSTSCTITLGALPDRAVYVRPVFRTTGGAETRDPIHIY